jgi:hypothetical protein
VPLGTHFTFQTAFSAFAELAISNLSLQATVARMRAPLPSLRAKRSNPSHGLGGADEMDCFVARAPRNDGVKSNALHKRLSYSAKAEYPVRRGFSIPITGACDYWVTRFSRVTTALIQFPTA